MTRAFILAVGSELLTPHRIDTNSLAITERLNEIGFAVVGKAAVGDSSPELAALLRYALEHANLVVLTGGLGPTEDDITREVAAQVLGLTLAEDERIASIIQRRFESRGLRMPAINRRQAMVPAGATVLDNAHGTAPGLLIPRVGGFVLLLPGPPREMQPMLDVVVRDRLAAHTSGRRLYRRVLRIAGRPESHVDEVTQPIYSRWTDEPEPIETTILAAAGEIQLHISMFSASSAAATERLQRAVEDLTQALGASVYAVDDRRMEEVVGTLLRSRGLRIAVAESCSGGLFASRLTDVPGSSDYVECGLVTYSNAAKVKFAGVQQPVIDEHGAVSEPVAEALAQGVKRAANVDIGVGITGIAGPGGGSERKPVGTVVIAVAAQNKSVVRTFRFPGDREQIKFQSTQAAFDMVRRLLIDSDV